MYVLDQKEMGGIFHEVLKDVFEITFDEFGFINIS